MDYQILMNFWAGVSPTFAPSIVVSSLVLMCLWYLGRYFLRSFFLSARLKALTRQLHLVHDKPPSQRLTSLNEVFKGHALEHAWKEYAETLHNQFEMCDGEQRLLCSRATAGSGSFFSTQNVVETPLGTEFYKHLPGILTGIGIVGTFFGLMLGLQHFDPSTPEQVTSSVDKLLKDVLYAFLGSFVAILASILVTLSEKWRLGRCYKHLEALNETVDSLFESGVGEEYLAELVKSSSESSIQTRQLKDSLVTDLREMLQNLVDTQVRESLKLAETLSATYRDSGQLLADQVSGAIEISLKSPLEKIAGAVQTASGEQSGQVQSLLQDVLVAFMSKLETTFGQQFSGMHEMLEQSVVAMQSMQSGFANLIQDMRSASEQSTQGNSSMVAQLLADMQAGHHAMQAGMNDMLVNLQDAVTKMSSQGEEANARMAQQLHKIFAESEARQQAMADNLQVFVESIKQSVSQGQQDTMDKIASSVEQLSDHLGSVFKQLELGQTQMAEASRNTQAELHHGTHALVGELGGQVKTLLTAVDQGQQETMTKMSSSVEMLGVQLGSVFKQLELGQQQMVEASHSAQEELQQGTHKLVTGLSEQVQTLLQNVDKQQESTRQTLKLLSEQTEQHLRDMQSGADKMRTAAGRFESAGERLGQVSQATAGVMDKVQAVGTELAGASHELATVVADYRNNREALNKTLILLEGMVANAQTELSARSQFLKDLKLHSERMQSYNQEIQEYLGLVSGVLGSGFSEFSEGIDRSLRQTLGALDTQLHGAVTSLAGGVDSIRESMDDLSDILSTTRR